MVFCWVRLGGFSKAYLFADMQDVVVLFYSLTVDLEVPACQTPKAENS